MMPNKIRTSLSTVWEGEAIVLRDGDTVIDRISGPEIHRVILVSDRGDTPTDLSFAIVETATDHVVLPAETGIAGRVHFEHQKFWRERSCVYWVSNSSAALPRHLRPGVWLLRRNRPAYIRIPIGELAPTLAQWPLEGPQSWEQRKWARILASRSLPAPGERAPK